jgi:cytochrome c peroxidase
MCFPDPGLSGIFRNAALLVSACFATSLPAANLQLSVVPSYGDHPLTLDSLTLQNKAGEMWSVTRLSYFISGVSLQREDGTWHDCPGSLAWMNAATNRNSFVVKDIPPGDYQTLKFHIGLDPAQNASDPASHPPDHPLNPNLSGLHWSWLGGYIFMALEGRFQSASEAKPSGYAYHLARDPFRTAITVPCRVSIRDNTTLSLRFDMASVIEGLNSISFVSDGISTHSKEGDPLANLLQENLARSFSVPTQTIAATESPSPKLSKTLDLPASFTPFRFEMDATFPMPALPKDNPLLEERVTLGRMLFHETALSKNGSLSCASCHLAESALSDPRQFSPGVENRLGNRNAMPLFNLAWKTAFFWDGRASSLREQVLQPIQDHREMNETLEKVVSNLAAMPAYQTAFQRAFGSGHISAHNLALALENFLLTLNSHNSRFDRAYRGEIQLTSVEKRGFELFMTEREPRLGSMGGDCFHCHGGALFTDHQFRNNGLPIDDTDLGRFLVTKASIDRGAFSTPSLRNVALTAPYMHDGRFTTLEQVLDHYSEGIQYTDTLDPNLAKHPTGGLRLSPEDKQALIAFLKTLTDDRFASLPSNSQG